MFNSARSEILQMWFWLIKRLYFLSTLPSLLHTEQCQEALVSSVAAVIKYIEDIFCERNNRMSCHLHQDRTGRYSSARSWTLRCLLKALWLIPCMQTNEPNWSGGCIVIFLLLRDGESVISAFSIDHFRLEYWVVCTPARCFWQRSETILTWTAKHNLLYYFNVNPTYDS